MLPKKNILYSVLQQGNVLCAVFLGFVLILSGCATSERQISVDLARNDTALELIALDKAVAAYIGSTQPSSPTVGGIGPALGGGGQTPYRMQESYSLSLAMMQKMPITQHRALIVRARGRMGRSDYLLPAGAGILVEPIRVSFRANIAEFELGHRFTIAPNRRWRAHFELGAGQQIAHVKTRTRSPVLNTSNGSAIQASYGFVSAELPVARTGAKIGVRARLNDRKKAHFGYYLGYDF